MDRPLKQTGTIIGSSNTKVLVNMKDVLYIPDLRDNLMSVKKLAKAGISVLFSGTKATLKKDGMTVAVAYLNDSSCVVDSELPDSLTGSEEFPEADECATDVSSNGEPSALPPHLEHHEPLKQASVRRSGRERSLPGKSWFIQLILVQFLLVFLLMFQKIFPTLVLNRTMLVEDERRSEPNSFEKNYSWNLTMCPDGMKLLIPEWMFRLNEDDHSRPLHYEARLAAKNYLQQLGQDFEETHPAGARLAAIHVVFVDGVISRNVERDGLHGGSRQSLHAVNRSTGYHFACDHEASGLVKIEGIEKQDQLADVSTKLLEFRLGPETDAGLHERERVLKE
ncbi:uncharacterized protein LOC129761001 [Uranotaenia lowii]|uniref:uncharacterized protein LOC129761001 n=1 Tax=Uranotaenia lowii TaxID=190385 RepID=UPI002479D213|nr:uncharacterized protein LOC129761001 [Uranotaenia lowii]